MNFPIPVNMTVDSGEAIQMTVQGDVTVSCVVDLRISPNVQETYDGPYSVTPSESVQTLETDEKLMADNVTVGAIPADYIGSSVPRKTSEDLTASGPTVTAPAGYYQNDATKTMPAASATTVTATFVQPQLSVDSYGIVNAYVPTVENVWFRPITSDGFVSTSTVFRMNKQGGDAFLQLPAQAAQTITPTESEQTAVAAGKFTTGAVKVGAIPSDYIGSEVPQKSSSDLTVSGATVTAPAGYYASAAQKSIPNATIGYGGTFHIVPDMAVDSNGVVSCSYDSTDAIMPIQQSGYADSNSIVLVGLDVSKTLQLPTQAAQTITPTTADQTIASGKYLTGAQTVKGDSNLVGANIVYGSSIFGVAGEVVPLQVSQDPVTNVLSIS